MEKTETRKLCVIGETRSGAACVISLVLLALTIYGCDGTTLSMDRPERRAAPSPVDNRLSTVSLSATVDLDRMEAELNEAIPSVIDNFSGERGGCFRTRKLGISISIGCRWHGEVTKRGPLSVSGTGDILSFSLPAHAWVTGSNRSGPTVSETARADFTVGATVRPRFGGDWTFDPGVNMDLTWDRRPTLRLFGLIDVRVTGMVEDEVRELLDDVKAKFEAEMKALDVRGMAAEMWAVLQEPLRLSDAPDAWLDVRPETVSFSGVHVANGVLSVNLMLGGQLAAVVGDEAPVERNNVPLPELGNHSATAPGRVSLVLPVSIGYEVLEREVEAALGAGREWTPSGGSSALTVHDVEVYPSSPNVVVGVTFSAYQQNALFDTTATVYLWGKPVADSEDKVVRIDDLEFAVMADNSVVEAASQLFGEELVRRIGERLIFDFGFDYDRLVASVSSGLNRELGAGIHMEGNLDFVEIGHVLALGDHLRVGVVAGGELAVRYGT